MNRAEETYRGFTIGGRPGKVYVFTFPVLFSSRKQAREAVDKCLNLRAEMEGKCPEEQSLLPGLS
jgi:hypothetical protein